MAAGFGGLGGASEGRLLTWIDLHGLTPGRLDPLGGPRGGRMSACPSHEPVVGSGPRPRPNLSHVAPPATWGVR